MRHDDIEAYLSRLTPKRTGVLKAMEEYGRARTFPLIGPLVGRVLFQLAKGIQARHVVELGSGFGYSAMWFAMALGPRGHITLTDSDPKNRDRALAFFKRANIRTTIDYQVGDALEIAQRLRGKCDIMLNDIDKQDYPKTISIAARMVRRGGLFITDNLLGSGRVMRNNPDKQTTGVVQFTKKLYADKRFFTTLLPIRDGISVATRL